MLLVTNAIEYLDRVDRILVFNNGRICEEGKYRDLLSSNRMLTSFVNALEVNRGSSRGSRSEYGEDSRMSTTNTQESELSVLLFINGNRRMEKWLILKLKID